MGVAVDGRGSPIFDDDRQHAGTAFCEAARLPLDLPPCEPGSVVEVSFINVCDSEQVFIASLLGTEEA